MKMLINLEPRGIFCSKFVFHCILTLTNRWYVNCDEASPSIILAGRALLVKMLKTRGSHGIFCSNFVYLCILKLSSNWYAKR